MKYLFFLIFALVHLALVISSPEGPAKLKYLKIYGLAIVATFLMAVLVMFAIKLSGAYPSAQTKAFFFAVLMSILAVLLANSMVVIGNYMIELLLNHHRGNGIPAAEQAQVRFVARNRQMISYVLKGIFLLATLWGLYGLWFGKK